MSAKVTTGKSPKMVNVALQGGGAHGAFTWGVLDRLLEDGRIGFEAISGTSAGAMNAVVVANGIMKDGSDGARQALEDFWQAVSREGAKSPIQRSLANMFTGDWNLDTSPGYLFFDNLTRLVSPYDPLNYNPIRDLLEAQIDFDQVTTCDKLKLFVSATNVHTGRVRVFTCSEITADVVMASACLPLMFQAVEIDGVPYWDGGYMGNPALHRIEPGEEMLALSASSKLNAEWAFLIHLRDIGRAAASRWLEESFDRIGKESSVDIRTLFAG
jgi:NTE family protein